MPIAPCLWLMTNTPFNRFQPKIMFIEPLSQKSQKRLSRRSPVTVKGDGA